MAAVFGGTQSLHTNSLDEAIALPTDFSAKIARDTQKILQGDTDMTKALDPWGGSYYVEYLTGKLVERAWALIQEVENLGGMAKAIEEGLPKRRIEEAAARKQARIDSGQEKIIGINIFTPEQDEDLDILQVDNSAVRQSQIQRLQKVKTERDNESVQNILRRITEGAKNPEANLLSLAVEAARARATLGEISEAMEKEFGRYQATPQTITGVYANSIKMDDTFAEAKALCEEFEQQTGRRPRILVAKLGQDGHDRGAKVIATSFADIGFDVDISPLFQTPEEIALQASDNDVHFVGISSLAGGHKTLVPETIKALENLDRKDIRVVVGRSHSPSGLRILIRCRCCRNFWPRYRHCQSSYCLVDR